MPARSIPAIAPSAPATDEEQMLRAAKLGPDFSFQGRQFLAKVVDVYDGDTCRVVFVYGGAPVQYCARMAGYDSPEMRPPVADPNREAVKRAAVAARAALLSRVADDLVTIDCGPFDKYGRVLVTMRDRAGEDLNAWMVREGHGKPYDGGRKS